MGDTVISAEGIGKRYRIGLREKTPKIAWQAFRKWVSSPVEAVRRSRRQHEEEQTLWALRDVSFQITEGQVVGIIGRNGSGKSTLLRILSRVTLPTTGCVRISGRVGSLLEVGTGFHPEMTGRQNIYLNGAMLGMNRREIERKFDDIVAFSEVEKFIDTPVKRYSSGMYVRLGFAVAAHLEPEILIVDEVLSVGDYAFQQKCMRKIEEIRQSGRTILLVSHNMMTVSQLCHSAILLEAGRIVSQGISRDVIANYVGVKDAPLGEADIDPSGGAHGVSLLRGRVTDEDSRRVESLDHKQPFCVSVEYDVAAPMKDIHVGVRLFNERNIDAALATTLDCPELAPRTCTPGRHIARVRFPGGLLAPGRYYVSLAVCSVPQIHHVADRAFCFDVKSDLLFPGNEVFRPMLDWYIE